MKTAKKKNPSDLTTRNLRKTRRDILEINIQIAAWAERVTRLEAAVKALLKFRARPVTGIPARA